MGILANALAIGLGGLIGCIIKKELPVKKFAIFGVCVAIISLVSFFENVYQVVKKIPYGKTHKKHQGVSVWNLFLSFLKMA